MSRYFGSQQVELLAPAGTFEIFKKIIHSGADAVYFGGKILNMRMHRKDYNLSNEEIRDAIEIAHGLGKKIYITLNNLFSEKDLDDAVDYLKFLESVQPDALLIQDLSILELVREHQISIPLHASVMMNVHNLETIRSLKKQGVTRIVASREMALDDINILHQQTDMEFEYFTHGDMCIAHGSQCLYSGILFGKSSNRGLCMKPCRWDFKTKINNLIYPTEYPMAVKDLSMYEHLPEMIQAGITSFKIEGRMRDSDYLIDLINEYSDAIDRYLNDPIAFDRQKASQKIYDNRKRDLSTAFAFGKPGLSNINRRYEGTGKFYSHGKVFSKPIEEWSISSKRITEIKNTLKNTCIPSTAPLICVKVNSYKQAMVALDENVDVLYLSGEVFEPDQPFSKEEILSLTAQKHESKIYLCMPRMAYSSDFANYHQLLQNSNLGLDGLVVTSLGAINSFKNKGLELIGDYCMNIYNHKAADFYIKQGLSTVTLSVETPIDNFREMMSKTSLPVELIVHGSPVVMYLEHDLYENKSLLATEKATHQHYDENTLLLIDENGYEHPVYRDANGRNHMTLYKDLCYLPILKELHNNGVNRFRIEGCHYKSHDLRALLKVYKKAAKNLNICDQLFDTLSSNSTPLSLGAFQFD